MLNTGRQQFRNYQKMRIIKDILFMIYLGDYMNMKNSLFLIGMGIVGTIMYQQIKNGNFRKMVREMNRAKTKMIEDMENMM